MPDEEWKPVVDGIEDRVRDLEVSMKNVLSAFPGSDVEGHRRYHELIISNMATSQRLKEEVVGKIVSGSIWAVIVGLALLLYTGLIHFIGSSK